MGRAWSTFRQTRDQSDWEVYRQLRNMSKTKTCNAKSNIVSLMILRTLNISGTKSNQSLIHLINTLSAKYLEVRFIKLASNILMYPLSDLFNLSLTTSELPAIWKCVQITPLHKGGDVLDCNNYRPISFICSITKIFVKLIFNQLSHYLSINNILSSVQSGFRSNHSTTAALLNTNDVLSAADNGELTGAIFF